MSSALLLATKVTLLFGLAWVAQATWPKSSASLRHRILAWAFLASLILPGLSWLLPGWTPVTLPAATSAAAKPEPRLAPPPSDRNAPSWRRGEIDETRSVPTTQMAPATAETDFSGPVRRGFPWTDWAGRIAGANLSTALPLTWTVGSILLLLVLSAQIVALTYRVRRATPVSDRDWLTRLEGARRRSGVERSVALCRSARAHMPLVWGWGQPTILLPRDCDTWPVARREAVLAHELSHIARRDVPIHLLSHLVCAVYWFNPLCWWLKKRLANERELACDRRVIDRGADPACYAQQLLATAMAYRRSPGLAPVMAARAQLEGRIMAILESQPNRSARPRRIPAAVALITLVVVVPLARFSFGVATPAVADDGATGERHVDWRSEQRYQRSDTARFREELRRLGIDASDMPSLLAELDARSPRARAASAWALGTLGDARAVEPLIARLADDDAIVRQWTVRSLGALGASSAVMPLIDRLDDEDAAVREWVVRSLGKIGDPTAADPLLAYLDDDNAEVREWIIRSQIALANENAVAPLVVALADDEAEVREWAVRALASLGDASAVDPLIARLDDEDTEVREWAARALATLADPRAAEALIASLGDAEAEVREWAVRALASLGDASAVDPLVARLDDEDAEVREWAARALGTVARSETKREGWVRSWRESGEPEPLMPALDHPSPVAGDSAAITALIRSLESPDREVREWSARSLGSMGDDSAVQPLIARIQDDVEEVREWSIRSLGVFRDRRATLPLITTLEDPNAEIREWSVRSLGVMQDERMVAPLLSRLEDDDAAVREWAVRALGAYGDPRATAPLERLLEDEVEDVRYWAGRALEKLRG